MCDVNINVRLYLYKCATKFIHWGKFQIKQYEGKQSYNGSNQIDACRTDAHSESCPEGSS